MFFKNCILSAVQPKLSCTPCLHIFCSKIPCLLFSRTILSRYINRLQIMSVAKPTVYIPSKFRFDGIKQLEEIVYSQLDVIHDDQLRANPELGAQCQAAFWVESEGVMVMKAQSEGLLPNLKLICNHGVGVNHIPFDKLKQLGIRVTNTPHVLTDCCADIAFALILASGRQLLKGAEIAMRSGDKVYDVFYNTYLGTDINHATLGIVGMGGIVYKVAKRAIAFNMTVLYHSRTQRSEDDDIAAVNPTYYPNLMDMLPHCDFVVICCPLTPQTEKMFKLEQFNVMKPTAYIINVARGKVIDTDSLVDALNQNKIRGAGLDVTDPEPLPPNHPLLSMSDRVIISPHWGSATVQTRGKMLQLMIDNTKSFYKYGTLKTEVTQ